MPTRAAVPPLHLAKLRVVCLDLPEVAEVAAWAGTRWTVRGKNFAHALMIEQGWPPAYARAVGSQGPRCVLTFRTPHATAPRFARAPFFVPGWFPNLVGITLDERVDWVELGALIVASYCVLAPKKLAARVEGA